MTRRAAVPVLILAGLALPGALAAQEEAPAVRPPQLDSVFPQPPLSPAGAFFRSLVIPGWAQAELGAKTRGAFYFFAETTSLFMIVRTQIRLAHARRTEPPDSPLIKSRTQQREDWIALAVFWAFFSAADGWVAVQLFGFEERTESGEAAFQIGWKIPFGP